MRDARIATTFRSHPKRIKLQRRLGPDGPLALIDLILFATESRPSGALSGLTPDDIAIAAQWNGDSEKFVSALLEIGFLDKSEHGEYALHDWCAHNPYAASFDERSLLARVNAHVGWLKRKGIRCNVRGCELCRSHANRMRSSKKGNAPPPPHHSLSPLTTHSKEKKPAASRPRPAAATFPDDSREVKAARYLFEKIRTNNPKAKEPNWQVWAKIFDLIFRVDKRDHREVRERIDFSQTDTFWLQNILSPAALRKQYDRLTLAAEKPAKPKFDPMRTVV